jgi:hypothetical protein
MTDLPHILRLDKRKEDGLENYTYNAPEGHWTGRFDDRAWGKSRNLLVYFTDVDTNQKYRLSVFANNNYKPYQGGPSFRREALGNQYRVITERSKNGLPKFLEAVPVQSD